ncbi:small multi-drug export protein [Bacillus swezeyi]|uniref:small multi-drug export protein n=1 Tax=Bacillus swezeyi TaxID=1925020 RepID=UPI002E20AB87|nr:small multi-drug export protein [Bacillus swezeyi]MED2978271.1 small multi-drug export protein [Bacillus swezeyi]
MDILWGYILVFILAAIPWFEVIGVVPLAIIAGLKPVPSAVIALFGNLLTVLMLIVLIDKVKQWLDGRRKESVQKDKLSKRKSRAKKIWHTYGLPGLSFIGPFFIGSHLTAFMCMGFGAGRRRTAWWMTGSLALWTTASAIAAYYGFSFLAPEHEGVLKNIFKQEE